MSRVTTVLMLVGVLFLMPVVAQATLMENLTTPATIFYDGFEGVTPPATPVAVTGAWGATTTADVADLASAGFGAREGSQFLLFDNSADYARGEGLSANSSDGDAIKLQFAIRCESGKGLSFQAMDGNGTVLVYMGFIGPVAFDAARPANNIYFATSTDGITLSSWSLTPGAWNDITLTHTNGTSSWTVSSGSNTFTYSKSENPGNWSWFNMNAITSGAVTGIDAVPEPSTLALLATGLIGLLCYAWRKRKCAPR